MKGHSTSIHGANKTAGCKDQEYNNMLLYIVTVTLLPQQCTVTMLPLMIIVIGFTPVSFALDEEDIIDDDIQQAEKDAPILKNSKFPPKFKPQDPTKRDTEKFDGITIRNIPKTLDDKEIFEFLMNYGMPGDHGIENIRINKAERNTWVVIDGISPTEVQTMFSSIDFHETKQKFFDVALYCKPLRNSSPLKSGSPKPHPKSPSNEDTNPQAASKEEATNDETIDIPDAKEIDTTQRPLIPGLPETERVKKPKGKKKTSKKKSDETVVKEREFFLKTPEVTKQASSDLLSAYQFSDYEDEAKDEKDTDEEFEDSKEALSDDELLDSQPNADFLTPVNLKSTFATVQS